MNTKWKVLVYFAGDNNLTEEMVWSIREMADFSKDTTCEVDVIAQFDARGSDARTFRFVKGAGDGDLMGLGSLRPPARGEAFRPIIRACAAHADETHAGMVIAGLEEKIEQIASLGARAIIDSLDFGDPGADQPRRDLARQTLTSCLERLPDILADKSTANAQLENFIIDQVNLFDDSVFVNPDYQFIVILSGHGSGIVGDFLTDQDPESSLSIRQLAQLLAMGRKAYAANMDRGRKPEEKLKWDTVDWSLTLEQWETKYRESSPVHIWRIAFHLNAVN